MDNIANMLTIIRNAQAAKRASTKAPHSRVNFAVAQILKQGGWINNIELKKRGEKSWIIIDLAYPDDGYGAISGIERVSKAGKRIYAGYKDLLPVKQGFGLLIVSTPQGIMTGSQAKKKKLGGEILCKVY